MRKIFLGIVLSVFLISEKAYAKDPYDRIFCLNTATDEVFIIQNEPDFKKISSDRCIEWKIKYMSNINYPVEETTLEVYETRKKIVLSPEEKEKKQKVQQLISEKISKDEQRQLTLEKDYGKECTKFTKGTDKYKSCLEEVEKISKNEQRQLTLEKDYGKECTKFTKGTDKYKNCLEEKDKYRKAIELALKKSKEEEIIKLEKMSPDDRRAYNCSEKFGFRKGSDKFKDCVFKIYQAEVELEKLELQKQLLKANIELAKANADRQDRLAQAQAETAKMQSLAAQQQANSARTAETLALLDMSLRLLAPPAAPPINRTTCSFNGRFMNCF